MVDEDHDSQSPALADTQQQGLTKARSIHPSHGGWTHVNHPPEFPGRFNFAHPESRSFTLGKLERDQVEESHRRKGMSLADVERWLAPNLNYDP